MILHTFKFYKNNLQSNWSLFRKSGKEEAGGNKDKIRKFQTVIKWLNCFFQQKSNFIYGQQPNIEKYFLAIMVAKKKKEREGKEKKNNCK